MRISLTGLLLAALALAPASCMDEAAPSPPPFQATQEDVAAVAAAVDCPRGTARGTRRRSVPGAPQFALQGGANDFDPCVGRRLGARIARVEFPIGTPVRTMRPHVAAYAARGIRVLLLAGFAGGIPSTDQARSVAAWGREFGPGGRFWRGRTGGRFAVRHIEFGNETSYAYQGTERNGGDYARRARDAARALRGRGGNRQVGLLVQADDARTGQRWVDQMYDAVGDLHSYVGGWTVHPYGPQERWQPRLDQLVARTAARGAPASIPIDVTEWGLATDNGRCLSDNYGWNRCMTYAQAGEALLRSAEGMMERYDGRIRHFVIYHGRDQKLPGASENREDYFGALTREERTKDGFTRTVRDLLAIGG